MKRDNDAFQFYLVRLSAVAVGCLVSTFIQLDKGGYIRCICIRYIAHIKNRKIVSALMLCMPSPSCHIKTKNKNKSKEKWECIGINRLFCSKFRIDATYIGTENVMYLSYKQNVQKVNSLTLLCMSPLRLRLRILRFEFNS